MRRAACVMTLMGLIAILITSAAVAQNALGAGDLLDANLSRTGGRRNSPTQQPDYRARNLLVTGNVAGGRGFRDSVGYAAAGDFLGELGSDDYYQFRAGSAFSALPYVNSGNTYNRLRFGRQLDLIEYPRTGYGSTIRGVGEPRYTVGQLNDVQIWLDRVSRASSIGSLAEENAQSSIAGTAMIVDESGQPTGQLYLNVSSLRGVFASDYGQHVQLLGLSEYDKAELVADFEGESSVRPAGSMFAAGAMDLAQASERMEGEMAETRRDLERAPDYKRIIERLAARYADADLYDMRVDESLLKELDIDLERLRSELAEAGTQQGAETQLPPLAGETPEGERPQLPGGVTSPFQEKDETEIDDERRAPGVPSTERLIMALRHGETMRTLTGAETDRLNRLMASGEQYLREGEYFYAERRFERACQFAPNHPLAVVGMGHSQLGAGLYLSASLTLRNLLTAHPEMIDTRYEEGLIPDRQHLLETIEKIRQRRDTDASIRAFNAFLLAYIGHQLQDRALVESSLATMAETLPGDPLRLMLQKIWLAEPEEEEPPGQAPNEEAEEAAAEPEK